MANMTHEGGHNRRALFVLFLLCLMVVAQSVALFGAPEPEHVTGHCCLLCHLGTLPFLEITTGLGVAPIELIERLIPNPDFEASHDVLLTSNSSRAPPA